jgi:hypothetical protein
VCDFRFRFIVSLSSAGRAISESGDLHNSDIDSTVWSLQRRERNALWSGDARWLASVRLSLEE